MTVMIETAVSVLNLTLKNHPGFLGAAGGGWGVFWIGPSQNACRGTGPAVAPPPVLRGIPEPLMSRPLLQNQISGMGWNPPPRPPSSLCDVEAG